MDEEESIDSTRLKSWTAGDWSELQQIWSDLDTGQSVPAPKFRGESISTRTAGYVFERLITEGFRLSKVRGHHSFVVSMERNLRAKEQVDGAVFAGWQGFLIESKYYPDPKVDFSPIARLHVLCEQRVVPTLGLFFSAFGFTAPAIESVGLLRPMRVLLFDRLDIGDAIDGKDFVKTVEKKWLLAVMYGKPALPVSQAIPDLFNG